MRQDIEWTTCEHDATHVECDRNYRPDSLYDTGMFQIAGDEQLQINVFINHARPVRDDYGHTFTWLATGETYGVEDDWSAGEPDPYGSRN